MVNANICIICGQMAGSREHIFPAAFGGRREDKGIYCKNHNEEFGRHVSALLEELDIFNAVLGVRPDRYDSVRPAKAMSSDGSTYMIAKGNVNIPNPPNLNDNFGFGQNTILSFPSQSDADKWARKQRKKGYGVKLKKVGPVETQFFTEPLHVQKSLGGTEFMRALIYFGLTYLAHHFPAYANSAGLDAAKAEIQKGGETELGLDVWWERPSSLAQLPPNPFLHGHCVAIAIEASGKAKALISLWGAIQFGMELGMVESPQSVRVVTYIDPLADRPPNDIEVKLEPNKSLVLGSSEDGRAYLREIGSGRAPHPMKDLLATAGSAQLRDNATALVSKIVAAKDLPRIERRDALIAAMTTESQRLFNLIQTGIDEFCEMQPSFPKELKAVLRELCKPDPNAPRGLSKTAEASLHIVLASFAIEMEKRLDNGSLDIETVENLISGGEGIALVFQALINPMMESILR